MSARPRTSSRCIGLNFLAAKHVEVEQDEPDDRDYDNADLEDHVCVLAPSAVKVPDASRHKNTVNMTQSGYVRELGRTIRRSDEPNG